SRLSAGSAAKSLADAGPHAKKRRAQCACCMSDVHSESAPLRIEPEELRRRGPAFRAGPSSEMRKTQRPTPHRRLLHALPRGGLAEASERSVRCLERISGIVRSRASVHPDAPAW